MNSPRIIHLASEAFPLAKSGGLGDVIGALPAALRRAGERAVVFLPAYPWTFERAATVAPLGHAVTIATRVGSHRFDLHHATLPESGCPVILFQCDSLFERARLYDEDGEEYGDNGYRFGVFCKAAFEAIKALEWAPRILHLHDWQAALAAVFLRTHYEEDRYFAGLRTVYTIHNLAYQGWADRGLLHELDLPAAIFHSFLIEANGAVNLMKGGIAFADHITTVSPQYAREIRTPAFGEGLDGILESRSDRLSGILNGVDATVWDPARDAFIPYRYDATDWARGKRAARDRLAATFELELDSATPLIGFIGRFTSQKGLDLLLEALPGVLDAGASLVMIGTGDRTLVDGWLHAAGTHPGRVGVKAVYDESLAHLIQAGADMIIMPSRFEPCGLNQLYAMKYGTVPVVHAVGGLRDTVVPVDADDLAAGYGTGFRFEHFNASDLVEAVRRACAHFSDRDAWSRLVSVCMRQDYSWDRSARTYQALYREVLVRSPHMPYRDLPHFPRPSMRPTYEEENRQMVEAFWHPYFESAMRLMAQSATSLYLYWELDEAARARFGDDARLELYDVTGGDVISIEMRETGLGEYWFGATADHTYEAAWVSGGRRVVASNAVRTPRGGPSDHWATDDGARYVTLDELSRKAREKLLERYGRMMTMIGRMDDSSPYRAQNVPEGGDE